MKRKKLYVVLATVGTLALLLAGLSGVAVVSAQETDESDDGPGCWLWGRGLFGFGRGGDWTMFDTVADELGLTAEELFSEMHEGKSLKEIAEDQGVDLDAMQETLEAARNQAMRDAIEQAVDDGEMSQEQGDWLLEGLEKGYMPGRGFGGAFRRGGRGPGMKGGFDRFAPGGLGLRSESSDTRTPALPRSSSL
ncbi:MAG: hypothetical protein U9R72_02180 [Chloroflexota bacterium]|nr:hypothetical protein [Chloroflexota bacterium]